MKTPHLILLLVVAASALTGCSTISSRIDQRSEVFAALPADDQARLRRGEVAVGDSSDMVYIALGEPTRRRETITPDSARTEWIYRVYEENFEIWRDNPEAASGAADNKELVAAGKTLERYGLPSCGADL